jgi:tRNA pseudouridine38-40 synthase
VPRYALAIEYDGTDFCGWQSQSHLSHTQGFRTVQQSLEAALSQVANQPIAVVCSGRTDAGVHASGQIVHFDSPVERTPRAWMLGSNAHLPKTLAAFWCGEVHPDFHARYSALAREYCYTLINRQARPGLHARTLAWERMPLNADAMHRAAQSLLGEQDFTSFRTVACQAKRPWRRLDRLDVQREGDIIRFRVQANAFLHHMVRNLVGSLLVVGRGEQPVEWIQQVLQARDRTLAGPTAPAGGLVFVGAKYPHSAGLPDAFCADPKLERWSPQDGWDDEEANDV